jgi:hypothetical protein
MALSKSGRYLATGQVTYMGFTADIIIWDLENRQLLHRMGLHKVRSRSRKFQDVQGADRLVSCSFAGENPST